MRNRTLGTLGLVLLIVGVCGALVTGALVLASVTDADRWFDQGGSTPEGDGPTFDRRGPRWWNDDGSYSSDGEQIYYTGVGIDGDPIPRDGGFGMMASGGCVNCHGEDGRGGVFGGMMGGRLNVPDIRYSTLTSEREEEGETEAAWTDEDIATAVREGVEPNGDELVEYMPRWDISDADMDELIAYLKELD